MKKTLSEIAAQLRECAEIVENSEVLRVEFPEGMTGDQIMMLCMTIATRIAQWGLQENLAIESLEF